jgi:beta-galactosidase
VVEGLEKPILDQLRPELDFARRATVSGRLAIGGVEPVQQGTFAAGPGVREVTFRQPIQGRQFCLETLSAQDGKPFAAIAELDVFDHEGKSIPRTNWTIAYVDSEELASEDGSASNAIDGQSASFWHTAWSATQPGHPHQIVIDLGAPVKIGGFRYTPRAGAESPGHIKDYRVYVGNALVEAPKP